jgi:predicted transcriptional regulator of viral defense system
MYHRHVGSTREIIAHLSETARGGVFTLDDAVAAMHRARPETSRRISALVRAGWIARIKRGVFSIRPLEAPTALAVAEEDPWVVAARAFPSCYVGGWTAASHWGLTEQLFKTTLIVTARRMRRVNITLGSSAFHVVRDSRARPGGITTVWRATAKVPVSSVERTLLDACAHPAWVGGGRQLVELFRSATRDGLVREARLREAAASVRRGSALGRLGVLLDHFLPDATRLIAYAREHRGTGVVPFDPRVRRRGAFTGRWGIWLNVTLPDQGA